MKKSSVLFRKNRGFTLAETLLAVMIVLLVSGIVASGVPIAVNVYHRITDAANANVLLSTTMTELRDKLALATKINVPDSKQLTFKGNDGRSYKLSFERKSDSVTGLYLKDEANDDYSRLLVSNAAAAKNLCADFEKVSYDGGILKFEGLKIYRKSDTDEINSIAEIDEFHVKIITFIQED